MKKKNIINSILQNTRMPEGFFGRIILRGMNKGHASLSRWGLSQIEWKSDWTILDIGCGGGANLKRMADFCPQGNIRYRYILRKRKIRSKGNQETAEYSLLYLAGKRNEPTL